MKNKTYCIISGALIIALGLCAFNLIKAKLPTQQEKEIQQIQEAKSSVNLQEKLLEIRSKNADRLITQLENKTEIILLTEIGEHTIYHDKTADKNGFVQWAAGSSVKVINAYKAVLSIPTDSLRMSNTNGAVSIVYDEEDIKVKAVEITETTPVYEKSWFGEKYTNEEILALVQNAKDDIYEQINNDAEIKSECIDNLYMFFKEFAEQYQVASINVNNTQISTGYEFIEPPTIQYNHSDAKLNEVKYIVIHSTADYGVSAKKYYDVLNTNPDMNMSAHFFIDDKDVIQMLPLDIVSWNVGSKTEPKIPCYNENSISVEICVIDNQQQAIQNAADFVNNVLKPQYPNAQIVAHRWVKPTLCPDIIPDDETFNTLFN